LANRSGETRNFNFFSSPTFPMTKKLFVTSKTLCTL
jgi:hypothetical protein